MKALELNQQFILEVCQRLNDNKRIRSSLPQGGILFFDRKLPFLCVHRQRALPKEDTLTVSLVRGEAAYLVAAERKTLRSKTQSLIHQLVETLSPQFRGFLLLEVWTGTPQNIPITEPQASKPYFKIFTPEEDSKDYNSTHDVLRSNLRRIRIMKQRAEVDIHYVRRVAPNDLPPLLNNRIRSTLNCHLIGLEVTPIYHNPDTQESYPLVARKLQRTLSHALRCTYYDFTRSHTTHHPKHYHVFGRRTVTKAVYQIDQQLASINNAFDFLLQVTPINTIQAWKTFKRNGFEKAPIFHYRPSPIDPLAFKKALYNINISKVEDPTLEDLFQEKRNELDREISMLSDRGTKNFLYGSLQLYGAVTPSLLNTAQTILDKTPSRSGKNGKGGSITPQDFAQRSKDEFIHFQKQAAHFSSQAEVTNEVTGLMVSQGRLLISSESRIPKIRVEALIQHEVGTHILTYFNGSQQPFQLLACGLAECDKLQEGLSVLAEYLVGGLSRPRLRLLAGRVVASHSITNGATFIETFRLLDHTYNFDQKTAYNITMRIYRGGGLTKDAVYLQGLLEVMQYIQDGGDIMPLFVGKLGKQHVPIIQELQHRQILKAPLILPSYLENEKALKRMKKIKTGLSLLQLIKSIK